MNEKQPIDLTALFGLHANRFVADRTCIPDEVLPDVMQALKENGLSYHHSDEAQRIICGNALTTLYAYDKQHLQGFLDQNKDILIDAEWPTEADKFVYYLSYVTAPANSEIFDLIYRCYGSRPENGNNLWLRKNAAKYPADYAAYQHQQAAEGKRKFFALHPDFKL